MKSAQTLMVTVVLPILVSMVTVLMASSLTVVPVTLDTLESTVKVSYLATELLSN